MGLFRVGIYAVMAGLYVYSLAYDILYIPRIGFTWWIYKLVMLSIINLVLQTFYFTLCTVCAFSDTLTEKKDYGPHKKHPTVPSYWRYSRLHRLCDFMYYTSVFPVGMLTCSLYWTLYSINPNLVMPDWAHQLIPSFLNHVTHTAPIPFIIVDTLLTCHHSPSLRTGIIVSFILITAYFSIIFSAYVIEGFWLYPIFDYLSNMTRILFLGLAGGVLCTFYYIGYIFNILLWGKAPQSMPLTTSEQKAK